MIHECHPRPYRKVPLVGARASKQFPLVMDDLRLQHKNWVEMIPSLVTGVEDVDAIASKNLVMKWCKGKTEGRTFQTGEISVHLELPLDKYHQIIEHIETLTNTSVSLTVTFTNRHSFTYSVIMKSIIPEDPFSQSLKHCPKPRRIQVVSLRQSGQRLNLRASG
jgi:hypothetical protein